jgi:SAM-dependent methyltransferase
LRPPVDDAEPRIAVDVADRRSYDGALRDFYDPHYHDDKVAASRLAAERILPVVLSVVDATSMIDVGCGPGAWLEVARHLGIRELTGVEGEWASEWLGDERAAGRDFELVLVNLEDELRLPARFDLAICIEVVEHISAARGASFVADLCRCAPHVLLAAAIPGQRGPNHVNTQWPSHWARHFADHGYRPLDVVRPRIWGDDDLLVHYRQNPILFVHDDEYEQAARRALALTSPPLEALDLVHPSLFRRCRDELRAHSEPPGLRDRVQLAAGVPRALLRRLAR